MANITMGTTMADIWNITQTTTSGWLASTMTSLANTSDVTESFLDDVEEAREEQEEDFDSRSISKVIFTYVAPVLIFFGSTGNLVSFGVLQSKHFRNSPSSFVLSMLALVDTGVLCTGLMRLWIHAFTDGKLDLRNLTSAGCMFHSFFTYMLPQLSSWTLVLMTIERLLSVIVPFKAREICSRPRMIMAWLCIFAVLFCINSHAFKTLKLYVVVLPHISYNFCYFKFEYVNFHRTIWPWVDLTVLTIIPVLIVLPVNCVIVAHVVRAARRRQEQMHTKGGQAQLQSLTIMLIAISILFIITTTPVCIYFIGLNTWPADTNREQFNTWMAYTVSNLLYYCNNSFNFILYCLTGSRFRRALVAIVCCRDMKSKSSTSGSRYTATTNVATTVVSGKAGGHGTASLSTAAAGKPPPPITASNKEPGNGHM